MTVDADIDSKKVIDAAVDNDVDRIIELDPDQSYVRSFVDNMEIVDESYTLLRESVKIPDDFTKFAQNLLSDLAEEYDKAAYKLNLKKDKAKAQYKFIINKANEDINKIKENIAKRYNLTKLFDDGKEAVYGKLSDAKEHLYAISGSILNKKDKDSSNDKILITVTCHKINSGILKKLTDEGKNLVKKVLPEKDNDVYQKYLEGAFGKSPLIDHTVIHENTIKERTHDENYLKIIYETCDLSNPEFRKRLIYVNEAEQNKVLMSLTAKLYATIVDKANDVDYGDIPDTKGDITKLKNYNVMMDTVATLRDIVKEYKQDPKAINVISEAIANVETHKDEFTKAYRLGYEFPKLLYCTSVIAIIDSISYMIATCIEFVKTPKSESFDMVLDVMRYKKARDYIVFSNLEKLNQEYKNGNIDNVIKAVTKNAVVKEGFVVPAIIFGAVIAAGIVIGLRGILNIIQSIVFAVYNARNNYSQYWELQSMVLEANANSLELNHPDWDSNKIKEIYDRQMKVVERWRKRAERWRVTAKKAEVDTEKELKNIKKIDAEEFEDASKYDSSLF